MEVREFIQQTISQILDSVDDLNTTYAEKGAAVASLGDYKYNGTWRKNYVTDVDFDIALEVVTDKESGKGGKISIASVISAGGEATKKTQNQSVSKVHFTLPLMFPPHK